MKNILMIGYILTLFLVSSGILNAQEGKSNILWIITDDHRADALECYNRATTGKSESALGYVMSPNIDKLAEEGVLFTSAFCNSPMCAPSRGSMHQGRYPFRSGHYYYLNIHQEPDFVRPTVSQSLREIGYGTAVFGKTHWCINKWENGKADKPADLFDFTVHFTRDLARNGYGDIFNSGGKYEFPDGIFSAVMTEETITYPDGTQKTYITQLRDEEIPEKDLRIKAEVEK